MATRQIKMPVKENSEPEVEETFSQRKRPERGQFLLQVDKQTKGRLYDLGSRSGGSFNHQKELSDCESIVYDTADNSHALIEAVTASL